MTEQYFVAAEGILGIRTNLRKFPWSFGTVTPPATRDQFDRCVVRMNVQVSNSIAQPTGLDRQPIGKYHYFSGRPGEDAIWYNRPLMLGTKLQFKAEGLLGPEPTLTFNKSYLRFVTHRFMNVHSAGYILTDLTALLLLHRGFAPVHCSAFRYGDATVVIAAPPNTGKTLATMMACRDHGATFLSEDLAITDGRTIHAVPWTSTFRFYSDLDRSRWSRFGERLRGIFPPLELLPIRKPRPVTQYLPRERVQTSAAATHLVVLERGHEAVEQVDVDTADRNVRNLNRYEFNYARAPLVIAHEFFNPRLDIAGACEAEQRVLRTLVENVGRRLVVRSDSPTRYAQLILGALREESRHAPPVSSAA